MGHSGGVDDPLPYSDPAAPRLDPWVQLKYFTFHPSVYPRMVGATSPRPRPGEAAHVYDKEGRYFGSGFFNPPARVPVRMFHHGPQPPPDDLLESRLRQAVALRRDWLRLDETTEACRLVHSDGDLLPGLVVDRYADVLSIEVTTLGIWRLLPAWIPLLKECTGAKRIRVQVDPDIARIERIPAATIPGDDVRSVKFLENGIRYEADFTKGHKTGFFCDQRDNRRRLGQWTQGRRVLDICCYTGGFALSAKLAGGSPEVTAVDLDEEAIAQARRNMNINQTRLQLVHADAFTYLRQMVRNNASWPVVVVDPPKFVHSRDGYDEGMARYYDLNGLALRVAEPGGLFVTCSCSGLVTPEAFEAIVIKAAHRVGRRLQILDRTGAGPDHPVMSNCPESQYLKVLWARVV